MHNEKRLGFYGHLVYIRQVAETAKIKGSGHLEIVKKSSLKILFMLVCKNKKSLKELNGSYLHFELLNLLKEKKANGNAYFVLKGYLVDHHVDSGKPMVQFYTTKRSVTAATYGCRNVYDILGIFEIDIVDGIIINKNSLLEMFKNYFGFEF